MAAAAVAAAPASQTMSQPSPAAGPAAPDALAALQAASGARPKHRPAHLKSPLHGAYPSSLQSPLSTGTPKGTPKFFHSNGSAATAMRTPITPPSAYLDFLKAVSPAQSPAMHSSTSTHFSFSARSPSVHGGFKSPHLTRRPIPPAPLSARPALPSQPPSDHTASRVSAPAATPASAEAPTAAPAANSSKPLNKRPASPAPLPPRPASAATTTGRPPVHRQNSRPDLPRRPSLIIPESPSSVSFPSATSAKSARSLKSPYPSLSGSYTPSSAGAPLSAGGTSRAQPVVIRHTITRTVVRYTRRPGNGPNSAAPASAVEPASATVASAGPSMPRPSPSVKSEDESSLASSHWSTEGESEPGSPKSPVQNDGDRTPRPASNEQHEFIAPAKPLVGDVPPGKRRRLD